MLQDKEAGNGMMSHVHGALNHTLSICKGGGGMIPCASRGSCKLGEVEFENQGVPAAGQGVALMSSEQGWSWDLDPMPWPGSLGPGHNELWEPWHHFRYPLIHHRCTASHGTPASECPGRGMTAGFPVQTWGFPMARMPHHAKHGSWLGKEERPALPALPSLPLR